MEGRNVLLFHIFLVLVIVIVNVLLSSFCLSRIVEIMMRRPQNNGTKLPPGSVGLPVVEETLKLSSQSPSVFCGLRHKRYGNIVKTQTLGSPCVMMTYPEAARFAMVTGADLFRSCYTKSKERLIGPWAVFYHDGRFHSKMRKLVQSSLSLERVRTMVPAIEAIAVSTLESCCRNGGTRAITTYHEMKKIGERDSKEELMKAFQIIDQDKNGKISAADIQRIAKELGAESFTDKELH